MFTERVQSTREARKTATRRAVLAAAEELFTEVGYSATTVRDIAQRAGVSVGTVMGVGDKRQLLLLTVSGWIEGIHDELRSRRGASPDLLGVITPFLDLFTGREELSRAFGAAFIESSDHGEALASLKSLLVDETLARLSSTGLSPKDARELAEVLYHLYLGLLIGWAAGLHSTAELSARATSSINRLLAAFGVTS